MSPIRSFAIAAVLVVGALQPLPSAAAPVDIDKVNGAIRTEAGVEYGDLETVNGSINVAPDVVAGSAETVNGSIAIGERAQLGDAETVNGGISAGRSARIDGDAETVNGAISLDAGSSVGGQVSTVNGSIRLDAAQVGRGIETVNGDIDILNGSHVRGGILVQKPSTGWFNSSTPRVPRVVIGANSVVEGELVFEREVDLRVDPSAKIGAVRGAKAQPLEIERSN